MGGVTTVAAPVWFREQMTRLMGLKFAPADLTTHWEALSDIPEPVLAAAVSRAQRSRVDFPTPIELRQDADAVKHHAQPVAPEEDRGVALERPFTIDVPEAGRVFSVSREWRYYCDTCSDAGWSSSWCGDRTMAKPWHSSQHCGRRMEHMPHEWAHKCVCYDTNPALVRKRQAAATYAEKPGKAH